MAHLSSAPAASGSAAAVPPRREDIDNLRSLAVLLLIPFHTARLFDADPWHMKDAGAPFALAEPVLRLIGLWQMPLLFLLAGLSAAWALSRRGPGAFLRERAARLLLPLLFGMAVLVPPQVWVERATPGAPLRQSPPVFEGDYLSFLPHAFGCCYPEANLSWHHLWFLPYLFLYCAVLALMARRGAAPALARWVASRPIRLVLPGLALAAVEIVLRPRFPSTHNLVWDWADHAHYLLVVLLGWWMAHNPALEDAAFRARRALAAGAALLTALWLALLPEARGGLGLDAPVALRLLVRALAEWCVLLVLLALARRFLARRIAPLAAFAPLSMAFYMLHQTIIVLLGWAWFGWTGAPLAKALAIALLALAASIALAALAARVPGLRALLGVVRRQRARP
jgi:surface polysaccharide O-acyltransferase-like enzyme